MSTIEYKLAALGLKLPHPKPPVANYISCKFVGELLFVSGRVSELVGEVGSDVHEEEAKIAARDTVLLILSIVREEIDLNKISGIVKLQGFIRSSSGFTRQPYVLDGASELLIELWGDKGRHARTATGVSQLPFGATLQLDMVMQLFPPSSYPSLH